ncbi:glycosyltransferase family 4 protein, partial [Candidatus Peregrinibacteria bacterium]|nr:glycosyltransferase family 4 protein [Candidatus Peregrinibacteria bacterium]
LGLLRRQSTYATTICVSELSRKMYLGLGWDPEKTVEIPNGVDPLRFSPTPNPSPLRGRGENGPPSPQRGKGSGDGGLRLGCLARLTRDKGIDLLIEAVGDLQNTSLTIIGTGPEEPPLQALMKRKKITDRAMILHSFSDLNLFYQSLDIFILPSRDHDPFGLVAAEAMLCGVPVIVTDACGIAGYITNGKDAVVVKANNAGALSEGIASLQDSEKRKRIADQGTQTACARFSAERMIHEYDQLFR